MPTNWDFADMLGLTDLPSRLQKGYVWDLFGPRCVLKKLVQDFGSTFLDMFQKTYDRTLPSVYASRLSFISTQEQGGPCLCA